MSYVLDELNKESRMGAMGSGWSSMNAWTGAASAGGKAAASVAGVGGKHAGAMQAASMGAGAVAAEEPYGDGTADAQPRGPG